MQLQVDFYVLGTSDEQSRMRTVCRLADKVQKMDHDIHILTTDPDQSKKLDNLMWTFSQSSFLPHAMVNDSDAYQEQQPVLIHHQDLKNKSINNKPKVLINLREETPQTEQYHRLVEIVNQDEVVRNAGRNKYRDYKKKDFKIKTHHIAA